MGWQFSLQAVWNTRLKPELQTNTTNTSLKAVHQRNTQSRQLPKVELDHCFRFFANFVAVWCLCNLNRRGWRGWLRQVAPG
jgi:hypothetical protein